MKQNQTKLKLFIFIYDKYYKYKHYFEKWYFKVYFNIRLREGQKENWIKLFLFGQSDKTLPTRLGQC